VPREPLLAISPPSISEDELDRRVERLLQLQQLLFQNTQQGKHLSDQALTDRRKAASLLTSITEKTKQFSQPERREVEELQQAIGQIEKNTLTRSEDQVTTYVRNIDLLEKEIRENWEALKEASASKSLPKDGALKLRECEQAMKKINTYVEETRKHKIEILGNRSATEKVLEEVPQIREKLTTFIASSPLPAPQTDDFVVEEEQEYRAEPALQEVEVAREPGEEEEVVEENMEKGVWEVEVAAEMHENPEDLLAEVYDDLAVRSKQAEESVLAKVAENAAAWEGKEVYSAFFSVLMHMYQLDKANTAQPLSPSLATISYFLTAYRSETASNLSGFRAGLRQMRAEKAPFSDFIASVLNLDCTSPYPDIISAQLPYINTLMDNAIAAAAKSQPSAQLQQRYKLGGSLHLGEIATLFASIFTGNDLMYGEFLERLHPEHVKYADFLHYLLVYHMKLHKMDGISLFKQISEDNILDFDEFEYGVRHYINWGIPAESLQTLFTMMQNPDSGLIFRLDFIRFLRLQLFVENGENSDFWVGKMQVLRAFAETCLLRRKEVIVQLANKVREVAPDMQQIPFQVVQNLLQTLEEKRDIAPILAEIGETGVSFEGFVGIIEEYGLSISEKAYFHTDYANTQRTLTKAKASEAVSAFLATLT
jgi:hypothetical protein